MDGLLIIDKPAGLTSHDVVGRVRRILGTRRVGHTGTLDPFATGVMVVVVGQATRLAQFLDKDEKQYEAIIQFGYETDTGDRTGNRIPDDGTVVADLDDRVAAVDWEAVLPQFRGPVMQVPPMYSAKKIAGKKLYELARKGETIERKAVSVTIHRLGMAKETAGDPSPSTRRLDVTCSAGTYIRTLAADIARAAGLSAHLAELRRTRAGAFDLSLAKTLKELEDLPDPRAELVPMTAAVEHLRAFTLNEDRAAKTRNGLSSRPAEDFIDGEMVRMLDERGGLIAIGQYRADEKTVQPKVVFG